MIYPQRITDKHVSHALNHIVDELNGLTGQTAGLTTDLQFLSGTVATLQTKPPPFIAGSGMQFTVTTEAIAVSSTGVLSVLGTANQINVSGSGTVTLSTPQNIDTGAAVQFGQLNIAAGKLIVNSSGLPTKSNNVALVGQGYALIVAQGSATGQTGAVASVASYTTTASGGSFEIGGYIDVTAFTAGTISLLCDYTDPGGTARTLTIPLVALAGTIGTTVGSATDAQAVVVCIQTSGANPITIRTTVSIFTGVYNVYGWIKAVT